LLVVLVIPIGIERPREVDERLFVEGAAGRVDECGAVEGEASGTASKTTPPEGP